ncbi:MAG: lysophospholipid acyltransferase family protein, partial [Ignavibacteria bacterium]
GENSNYIFIFWHSKMLIGWWLFRKRKSAALVSQSKDGEILNNILERWNYRIVRGSSSKGGKAALQELTALVKDGYSAVITPDGPRGPAKEIKNGALIISMESMVPIIPVRIVYSSKKILKKSWDRFEIPLPFSKCEVHFGSEYNYEKFLEEKELDAFKKKLSGGM